MQGSTAYSMDVTRISFRWFIDHQIRCLVNHFGPFFYLVFFFDSIHDYDILYFYRLRSYGVVIWELATYGENPYNGKENEEVVEFVKNGGRLQLPSSAPNKL